MFISKVIKVHAEVVLVDSGYGHYQLLVDAKNGDELALLKLIKRFDGFLKAQSRNYFVVGASAEDVFQESLIGLYKAVRDYKFDYKLSFRNFAKLCIRRQVISAVNSAHCYKHQPLERFKSLQKIADSTVCYKELDPAKTTVLKEQLGFVMKSMEALPSIEKQVFQLHHKGLSYKQIAQKLNLSQKSVDNALQRTRHKLRKIFED